jgi:aryl-alcohol dehydrogenase-like predicted oxidoreductase/enamine deaminase RidA (YjgF/YER057c/UK114 family)
MTTSPAVPLMNQKPERYQLAPGLEVSRIIIGLWQIADMERDGRRLDFDKLAADLAAYTAAGFDTFDMADHYGSAEDVVGHFNVACQKYKVDAARILTKWCPRPVAASSDIVKAAVQRALERLRTGRIDLMQLHWWMFQHPGWIDALNELDALRAKGLIHHLGTTNFDTDHLRLAVSHGIPLVSSQVCFSLLDRRAAGRMTEYCLASGVRVLAYGTLAGGLLTEKWHCRSRPKADEVTDWSTMKYLRFVDAIGGWKVLQDILDCLAIVARKHNVSMANIAMRWVLQQAAVAAVIVGARLGDREHRMDNLRVFSFQLDEEDLERIGAAVAVINPVPGDCGDEYRRPPFLTATGDLSHHLSGLPKVYSAEPVPGRSGSWRVDTGSIWEPLAGYSRSVRVGNRILVSGTTATHGSGLMIAPHNPEAQAVYILDKIQASIEALGGTLEDIVRTRIYLRDHNDWEAVSRVHGRYLGHVRPANTLVEVSSLIGSYAVEIEAEAVVEDS